MAHAVCVPDHLRHHRSVTPSMRERVVGWVNQLVDDLHLATGINGVTINLFDRFLVACRAQPLSIGCLHAVTAACFLIACKTVCDDDGVPCVAMIGKRAKVSVEDMISMEVVVLNALQWRVGVVTPHEVIAQTYVYVKKMKEKEEEDGRRKRKRRGRSKNDTENSDSDSGNDGDGGGRIIGDAMLDALLLYALMEYRCAWVRATCTGVACMLVAQVANNYNNNNNNNGPWCSTTRSGCADCTGQCDDGQCDAQAEEYGRVVNAIRAEGLYREAQTAGVDMRQVEWCAYCLFEIVGVLCEDVEDVDEDEEDGQNSNIIN